VNIYLIERVKEVSKYVLQMVVNMCKVIFCSGTCQMMLINIGSSYWLI
jgi:hypothetical protein